MDGNKAKARPSAGTLERAAGNVLADCNSHVDCTSSPAAGQFKISYYLSIGQENAVPLRHLETVTGLKGREIRRMISAERLAGVPILADNHTGYYLPGTVAEARQCVRSMRGRAREIERAAEAIAAATEEV